jgi:hypothetical protein
MKYALEMDLSAMIYIPSFKKIVSAIQKLIGQDKETHRELGDAQAYFYFFK